MQYEVKWLELEVHPRPVSFQTVRTVPANCDASIKQTHSRSYCEVLVPFPGSGPLLNISLFVSKVPFEWADL